MDFFLLLGAVSIGYMAVDGIRECYGDTFKVETGEVKAKHSKGCYCGYCGAYCDTPFCKHCGAEQ